jgi:poly-gamma-glutamate system protein
MKRVYWRPKGVSTNAMLVIAAISTAAIGITEGFPEATSEAHLQQMLEASQLAGAALDEIKKERVRLKIPIEPIADPAGSGLIGVSISDITTNTGNLLAKQTTVNPNWAAVAVQLLHEAGVREGDTVAVGVSGSFPGLNVAVYAALASMKAQALVISSVSASQWGANHPRFLWLDMEKLLFEKRVFPYRSIAASMGGAEDRAAGLSEDGRALLLRAMKRSGLPLIEPESYAESVVERMALYRQHAEARPIAAYVNVGGGTSSVGTRRSKFAFKPGVNTATPPRAALIDSVMARFLDEGTPVIHFLQVNRMAERYGLPVSPQVRPPVGAGLVFLQQRYNPWLASAALAVVVASLFLFVRSGRGRMALQSTRPDDDRPLEPTL